VRADSLLPIPGLLGRGLETLYLFGVEIDRRRQARTPPHRLTVPVLSVGNIAVGGTGKTPVVEALARTWLDRGGKPGILSRGYRGGAAGNDEFRVLARRLPRVPHIAERDRSAGGERLLARHPEVDLVLLDDGFQHRRLERDLDLVLLDATRPFGGGRCLPAGLLREPWESLERADALLITRSEQVGEDLLRELEGFIAGRFPRLWLGRARRVVEGVRDASGIVTPVRAGTRVLAFCGLGNPAAFFASLPPLGLEVALERRFPDHHRYRGSELERLRGEARAAGAEALVTTEKDGVKLADLPGAAGGEPPILEIAIRAELPAGAILDRLPRRGGGGTMPAHPR